MGANCSRQGDSHFFQVGKYTLKVKKVIARGGYGFVYAAQDFDKSFYALKMVAVPDADSLSAFSKEVETIRVIGDHPNIIKVFASQKKQESGFIMMELAKMTLWKMVCETAEKRMSQQQSVYILRQIAEGLAHMHSKGIIHRDIKTENILVMDDGSVRICDFGSCTSQSIPLHNIKDSEKVEFKRQIERFTTVLFRPPELVNMDLGYTIDTQMDMWMLGCIAYILAYYKAPFKLVDNNPVFGGPLKLPQSPGVSQAMQKLILMLLQHNPAERATSGTTLSYLNKEFKIGRMSKIQVEVQEQR